MAMAQNPVNKDPNDSTKKEISNLTGFQWITSDNISKPGHTNSTPSTNTPVNLKFDYVNDKKEAPTGSFNKDTYAISYNNWPKTGSPVASKPASLSLTSTQAILMGDNGKKTLL